MNNIYQNLNLRPISNPNSTGNVISVPLITNKNSYNDSVAIDNKKKVAAKLIKHFFSPLRVLSSKPVFSTSAENNYNSILDTNKTTVLETETKYILSNNKDFITLARPAVNTVRPGGQIAIISGPTSKKVEVGKERQKVVINLFYYISNNNQALSNTAVNKLGSALAKLFGQPVELRLVRLHYPYLNSYILAQYVAINTKKYNFTRIQRAIFSSLLLPRPKSIASEFVSKLVENNSTSSVLLEQILPSHITGIMIRISGRLKTQRSIPRQTVQTAQIGTFSPSKGMKNVIEFASLTDKNKKGAFTVKVWISQLPSLSK